MVVTNPPYLGNSRFSAKLDTFIKKEYPNEKSDLSMAMFKKALSSYAKENGFVSFITTSSWMFLSSFEKLRKYVFENASITSLVDFGTELFDGKVGHNPVVAWVCRDTKLNYKMTAVRLADYCYSRRDEKEKEFFNDENRFSARQDNFEKIPGAPVAYWVSEKLIEAFEKGDMLKDIAAPKKGLDTADNERFIRYWHEINIKKACFFSNSHEEAKRSQKKWFPLNSGGNFRKWYGNFDKVINWENDGQEICNYPKAYVRARNYYFREGLSWTKISSSKLGVRYAPRGFIFDSAGQTVFADKENEMYILGLLCSCVAFFILQIINPTINYQVGDIERIPVIQIQDENARNIPEDNVKISKEDWDSFETSWDFKKHPLI